MSSSVSEENSVARIEFRYSHDDEADSIAEATEAAKLYAVEAGKLGYAKKVSGVTQRTEATNDANSGYLISLDGWMEPNASR